MLLKPAGYDFIQEKLSHVRETFELANRARKVNMIWRAYLFAMISSSTRLANHELGYSRLIRRFIVPEDATDYRMAEIAEILRTSVVMYHGQKASNIIEAAKIISRSAEIFELPDIELREWLANNLPGVARAKASFMLMLLGRTNVMCIDTHFQKIIGLVPGKPRLAYEFAEQMVRDGGLEPGIYQWSKWCEHMKVTIEKSHEIYFKSTY